MAKRTLSIVLALIMILGVFSVISVNAEIKILATKTLKVGQSADVHLTDPNTGAKLNTIWESSNPAIATVTSLGTVTGIKAGSCVVSTWWNGKNYGVKVIVKAAAKKISISKKSATLTVGKTLKLKLKNATASKVKWSTSNKKIATVSKGKVKAKKKGRATITAKYKGKKYKCKVTVKAKPAKKISLSKKSATLTVGKTLKLKLKNAKASKVKWSSSKKKVATVSKKGVVKAKKKGKATITAKYKGKKYKCKITVKAKKKVSVYTKLANYLKKNGTKYTNTTSYYIYWYEDGYVLWANYASKGNYVNMCIGEPAENPKDVFDVEECVNIGLFKSNKRKVQYFTKNPYSLYEKSYKKGTTVNTAKLKLKHTGGSELSNANSRARTLSKAGMSLWNKFLKARVGLTVKKLGFVYKQ